MAAVQDYRRHRNKSPKPVLKYLQLHSRTIACLQRTVKDASISVVKYSERPLQLYSLQDIDIVILRVVAHPFLGGKYWMSDSQADEEIHQQEWIEFSMSEFGAPKPQHMQRLGSGRGFCLISGRKSPATCLKSKQIQTGSGIITENTCRRIPVKKKYMTHSEGNLAQE